MNPLEKFRSAAQTLREAVPVFPDWDKAGHAIREGERLLEAGDAAGAEQVLAEAASSLLSRAATGIQTVKVLLALATARWRQNKFEEARDAAGQARRLISSMKTRPAAEHSACLDLLGSIALELGDTDSALRLLEEALETMRAAHPQDAAMLVERLRHLANAYWQAGRLPEAKQRLEDAATYASRKLGAVHPVTASCFLEYGQCLSELNEHAPARAALEQALEIDNELHGIDSEEAVRDLQALAVASRAADDLEAAVSYYERALRLRDRQVGGNSSEFASLLMSLAGIQSMLGRYAQSLELLQQAVCRLQGSRDNSLAPVLERLGETYAQCGRFDDAAACMKKARGIWEKSPEENQEALEANQQMLAEISDYLDPEEDEGFTGSIFKEEIPPAAPQPSSPMLPARRMTAPAAGQARRPWRAVDAPPAASHTPGGVRVQFVTPDGSPAEAVAAAAGGAPLSLTVVVPPSGFAPGAAALVAAPPAPPPPPAQPAGLKGWEELAFEFLPQR